MCIPDQNVYMTERHHTESFSYEIPILIEHRYTLILQFAEVFFFLIEKKEAIFFLDVVRTWKKGF